MLGVVQPPDSTNREIKFVGMKVWPHGWKYLLCIPKIHGLIPNAFHGHWGWVVPGAGVRDPGFATKCGFFGTQALRYVIPSKHYIKKYKGLKDKSKDSSPICVRPHVWFQHCIPTPFWLTTLSNLNIDISPGLIPKLSSPWIGPSIVSYCPWVP